MYPGMRYVPSARGYALHTLGPGYGEMYTHKTLKKHYNGGYALHHTRVHTLLHTRYPAREGMRVWGMEQG